MNRVDIGSMDMLSLSILVLFIGAFLNKKIGILRDNFIPPAVTGGILFSGGATLLYFTMDIEFTFDMRLRDLCLLFFFTTIGLSARLRALAAGGRAIFKLVIIAAVFLVVQDVTGVALAMLIGESPAYGLMGGSVSLAGGHGTAIAWGKEAEAAGLVGAEGIGITFATLGLIVGGLLGGPVARRLIKKNSLQAQGSTLAEAAQADEDAGEADKEHQLYDVLRTLLFLSIAVSAGDLFNRLLFSKGVLLPGFLVAMLIGIALTNVVGELGRPLNKRVTELFGDVSLNLFLAMSMMSMQLWLLTDSAQLIVFILIAQTIVMSLYASFFVFRAMGANYDASVIAAGFVGLGMGATPVAIANVDSVTSRYGPSPKALLVIPLVGAFFIDIMNAAVIKFFVKLIT